MTAYNEIAVLKQKKLDFFNNITVLYIRTGNFRSAKGFWENPEAFYYLWKYF